MTTCKRSCPSDCLSPRNSQQQRPNAFAPSCFPTCDRTQITSTDSMEASHLYNDRVKRRAVRRVRLNDLLCASLEFVLHRGRPWLSPSYTLLPRTRVHRVLLANTRLHASTWLSRSPTLSSRATHPTDLKVGQYRYLPSRVMCQQQEVSGVSPKVPAQ